MDVQVGDILVMKKEHPCGSYCAAVWTSACAAPVAGMS